MKQPVLMQQNKVAVAEIDASRRLRPVSEAGVQSLIASVTETGVMKDAIHVRKKKDGKLVLIAGAHRLEMARRLGWVEIEAKIWTDVTDDWARLMEIDDNLAGAEMNALDTAVFLAERKEVYERLHPETRAAIGAALVAKRWNPNTSDIVSFVSATADKFGISKRHVERMIAAGTALHASEVQQLRASKSPVKLADLQALAKIGDAVERQRVVEIFSDGQAKGIAAARQRYSADERGVQAPVKSAEDQQYLALLSAFSRASKSALRRFVADQFDALSPLVADEAEQRGAPDAAILRRGMAAK